MAARFGDEVAEMLHQVDPHWFLAVDLRAFYGLANTWIKILIEMKKLEEECLMINSRAKEPDLLVGNPDPLS